MRVLQVLGNLGYGGIESFLMNVYRHIDRNKIQFDFLVRSDDNGDKVKEIESMGGTVFFSPTFTKYPLANYSFVKKFFEEHSKEYDAIHVHCNSFIYPLPVSEGYKHGIKKIILHSHNTCNHGKVVTFYHRFNEKRYDDRLNYRFACSEAAGKWMFENKPFSVIHNGIDLDDFRINSGKRTEFRQMLGFADNDCVIGHVGRFSFQKNQEYLVELLDELQKKSSDYKLLYIGDGDTKSDVVKKAKELGVHNNIVFTGNVTNVQDYMQAMDLFVLPSRYEGLGIVSIEAQACGLPCVLSTDVPKEAKLTDNVEFVPICYKDKWIEAIEKMVKLPRADNTDIIREAGYDINETTKQLEVIYLNR